MAAARKAIYVCYAAEVRLLGLRDPKQLRVCFALPICHLSLPILSYACEVLVWAANLNVAEAAALPSVVPGGVFGSNRIV